jgi:hypothetical protein
MVQKTNGRYPDFTPGASMNKTLQRKRGEGRKPQRSEERTEYFRTARVLYP